MNTDDKAVLSAIKLAERAGVSNADREKAKAQSEKASAALNDHTLRAAFIRIFEYFATRDRMKEIGKPLAPPLVDILAVGRAGLVQSAEFAWMNAGDAVFDFPRSELLAAAPSARMLDSVARRHRDLTAEAFMYVLEHAEIAEISAAFEWVVQRAKPKDLARLAPQLISGHPRRRHLPPREEVLITALLRDKGGDVMRACFAIAKTHLPAFDCLRIAVNTTPKLLIQFIASLPKAISGPDGEVALQLFESWLPTFPKAAPADRENLSGLVATLAGHLLKLRKRKDPEQELLFAISRNARQWLAEMQQTKDCAHFWLVADAPELLAAEKPDAGLSHYGAGLIASSLDKAKSGVAGESLLEALALNLGMERIGTSGEAVSFDPAHHEDTVGGLLTGVPAKIIEPGWRLGDRVVRRSKVTPSKNA